MPAAVEQAMITNPWILGGEDISKGVVDLGLTTTKPIRDFWQCHYNGCLHYRIHTCHVMFFSFQNTNIYFFI